MTDQKKFLPDAFRTLGLHWTTHVYEQNRDTENLNLKIILYMYLSNILIWRISVEETKLIFLFFIYFLNKRKNYILPMRFFI